MNIIYTYIEKIKKLWNLDKKFLGNFETKLDIF